MTRRVLLVVVLGAAFALAQSDLRTREEHLKDALWTLRTAIDEYTFDHQKPPRSLDDLVRGHYLRQVPTDPITGSKSTWRILKENPGNAIQRDAPGIFDVRSASNKTASDGKRYSEW